MLWQVQFSFERGLTTCADALAGAGHGHGTAAGTTTGTGTTIAPAIVPAIEIGAADVIAAAAAAVAVKGTRGQAGMKFAGLFHSPEP